MEAVTRTSYCLHWIFDTLYTKYNTFLQENAYGQKYIQKLDLEDDILKVNTKYKQPILKALGMKGCLK